MTDVYDATGAAIDPGKTYYFQTADPVSDEDGPWVLRPDQSCVVVGGEGLIWCVRTNPPEGTEALFKIPARALWPTPTLAIGFALTRNTLHGDRLAKILMRLGRKELADGRVKG